MFRVGQKVVCVNSDFEFSPYYRQFPERGNVYTVGGFHPNKKSIFLVEVDNPWDNPLCPQCCFRADRFRPVVERKTDISVFTEILRKVSRKQGADA